MSGLVSRFAQPGITAKIMSMAGITLLSMAILIFVAYSNFHNQKKSIDDLYNQRFVNFKEAAFFLTGVANVNGALYKAMAWVNAGYDDVQIDALLDAQLRELAELTSRADEIVEGGRLHGAELASFEESRALLKTYAESASDVVDVITDTSYASLMMLIADDSFEAIRESLRTFSALEQSLGKESYDSAAESYSRGLRNFITTVVIGVLVSLSLTFLIARGLLRHISVARSTVALIASGDLTQSVRCDAKDEIGAMLHSVEDMRVNLARMITEVRSGAVELLQRSENLLETSYRAGESASEQSTSATLAAAAVQELHTGLNLVDENTGEVRRFAQDAGERSHQGSEIISRVVVEMNRISEQVAQSSDVVNALAGEAGNIGTIVDVIKGLSEQTNLLALNAAIEAARAGESGRGFSVVAAEVRNLADQTRRYTDEIASVVNGIQGQSKNATHAMELVSGQVSQGTTMAEEARMSIMAISENARDLTARMEAISHALGEQNSAAAEIAQTLENVANLSELSAKEANNVTDEASSMKSLSGQLSMAVERFSL